MMKSIAFFNNKGGVGKTTLACNAASYFARVQRLRVVLVDCDPQANATQLLLLDEDWQALYEDRDRAEQETILRALRNIRSGDSSVETDVTFHESERFAIRVLAGHPSLSALEDQLSTSWSEFQGRRIAGARRSLWARSLTQAIDADIVVFDLGPSLGALNRSVLLGCDYFMTPVAADLFSLYALENIGSWLASWLGEYTDFYQRLQQAEPSEVARHELPATVPLSSGYAGYSVQQYVTRNSGGLGRSVAAYDRYRQQIPDKAAQLDELKSPQASVTDLGIVPNMFSMVPLAQAAHAPIDDLSTADGVRGAQVTQQARYEEQLNAIFARLAANIGVPNV